MKPQALVKPADNHIPNQMALLSMLKAWKESAETTINFIKTHIPIIGEDEIKGYAVVKEMYQKALDIEKWSYEHELLSR